MIALLNFVAAAFLAAVLLPAASQAAPDVQLPVQRLLPRHLALVINERDPYSVAVGRYYARAHAIPSSNVIRTSFPVQTNLSRKAFSRIKKAVDAATPAHVQAYALAWTVPYKVACMSITSAFALGFDERFCASGCRGTRTTPYFDSDSRRPFDEFRMRPAMSLAGKTEADARRMIDRGVRAHHSWPDGTGYLVNTTDVRRNVRARGYGAIEQRWQGIADIRTAQASDMPGTRDILFYFTGATFVEGLHSNGFVDGALADHLTSAGGRLTGDKQMNVLRWLEAGATGSYGTVVEPCNITQKFPDPRIAIERYLSGESLLESYWKSVAMPGQGVFVGDPLTAPFAGAKVQRSGNGQVLLTRELRAGTYAVAGAKRAGTFRPLGTFEATGAAVRSMQLPATRYDCYRVTAPGATAQAAQGAACL